MTEKTPLVSVIMPAYNAERFIERAIGSVQKQTISDWELLVIDDSSTDKTVSIVQTLLESDARITLIRNEENLGVAQTRNKGIELSQGKYIAFLDSDDLWHPEKLEKQLNRMQTAKAMFGYCSYAMVDENDDPSHADYLVPETVTFEELLKENVIGCSTVVLDASIAKIHRFQTTFYHEDYVLWLQLLKNGVYAVGCTDVLVKWRHLENSRSFNKWKAAMNRWSIYRKQLRLPLSQSIGYILAYTVAGVRKYRKQERETVQ